MWQMVNDFAVRKSTLLCATSRKPHVGARLTLRNLQFVGLIRKMAETYARNLALVVKPLQTKWVWRRPSLPKPMPMTLFALSVILAFGVRPTSLERQPLGSGVVKDIEDSSVVTMEYRNAGLFLK